MPEGEEGTGVATKWEMISALAKHDIRIDYIADDLIEDLATLRDVSYLSTI